MSSTSYSKTMNTDPFEENGFEVHFKPERLVDGALISKSMLICFKQINNEDYVKFWIKNYEVDKHDEEEYGENTLTLVPEGQQEGSLEYFVFNVDYGLEKSKFCVFKFLGKWFYLKVSLKTESAQLLIKKIREFWYKD